MASRLTEVIIDCHDLEVEAKFWAAVLDYERVAGGDGWICIGPSGPFGPNPTDADWRAAAQPPNISFVLVPEEKSLKNRVHLDVTPIDGNQAQEVDRLTGLGARTVDIGQGAQSWVVMADPEGNEFCVMSPLEHPAD